MTDPLTFRVLIGPDDLPRTFGVEGLSRAYAWPAAPSVRANFVATLDGAVTGPDGLSGSLGNPADRAVFEMLRETCDVIVVGAGTARAEDYGPAADGTPLVVVSRGANFPPRLVESPDVVLVTTAAGGAELERFRRDLGADRVWVLGESEVDARALRDRLVARGHRRILHEGGPSLATQWLESGCVDELCLTQAPRLGGDGRHLLQPGDDSIEVRPVLLLEESGTLLGRWRIVRPDKG